MTIIGFLKILIDLLEESEDPPYNPVLHNDDGYYSIRVQLPDGDEFEIKATRL